MSRTVSLAVILVGGLATALLAAPIPKEKEAPLGPITPAQREQSKKNLTDIVLGMHNYHDTNGGLPTNQVTKEKKALLSWRVQLLPYLDEDKLYKQFKLDEPWDSDHNKKLIDKMPKVYAPVRGRAKAGETFYQGFSGSHGLIGTGEPRSLASMTDGTSNTILVAEAEKPVVWTKPEDLPFDGTEVPKLGGMFDGKYTVGMGDGVVYRFKKGLDAELLRRLIDPRDGNVVNVRDALDEDEKE